MGGDNFNCPMENRTKINQELGSFLTGLRQSNNLTVTEVARISDLSEGYINDLEFGRVDKPAPFALFALSGVYLYPYVKLMQKAGYITGPKEPSQDDLDVVQKFIDQFVMDRDPITGDVTNTKDCPVLMNELTAVRGAMKRVRSAFVTPRRMK